MTLEDMLARLKARDGPAPDLGRIYGQSSFVISVVIAKKRKPIGRSRRETFGRDPARESLRSGCDCEPAS